MALCGRSSCRSGRDRSTHRRRRAGTIHYSELVQGIEIQLPNVDNGRPFELGVPEWRDLDRAILGQILGKISLDSYAKHGILASALVTSKTSEEPSEGFWTLVEELGLSTATRQDARLLFWSDVLRQAHEWYAEH